MSPYFPWRSVVGTWLQTMELKPGMEIQRARGPPLRVIAVENTGRTQATFNIEVADTHTYFVGDAQAWVHNACPLANDGIGPKHGRNDHNDAIDSKVKELQTQDATDIRKNQQQVDVNGNKVGTNRSTMDGQQRPTPRQRVGTR
jgi:hypothetical protein